jgi:hypothetical protein
MMGYVLNPAREFIKGREPAEQQEIAGLQEGRLPAQFLNSDTAILKHPSRAVYVTDRGFCGRNPRETRHKVVRHSTFLSSQAACTSRYHY